MDYNVVLNVLLAVIVANNVLFSYGDGGDGGAGGYSDKKHYGVVVKGGAEWRGLIGCRLCDFVPWMYFMFLWMRISDF